LGAPGILLTSYGLILQLPELKKLANPAAIRSLKLAAAAFLVYALFTPIVPEARFFPASVFNYTVFLDRVGIPVQVFRALCAMLLAYSIAQILSIFDYETQETIRKLAYNDALTGLPNRTLFNDRLNMALAHGHRSGEKLAVMMLDLDRFKDVNDRLGHNVGDELLVCVGSRLINLLRASDTVARFGGDEFVLLLPDIAGAEGAIKIAEEILEVCRKPFLCSGHEVHTSTSIGIAIYPDDGGDAYTLIKHADVSMYHAKDSGRNNYQFYGLVPSKA
jgi:diguanylate cyclase (GGDEF)-like protein